MCIVSHLYGFFLFVYKFTDHCHRVETQLHLINIIIIIITITQHNLKPKNILRQQLVKKFAAFYRMQSCTLVFTTHCNPNHIQNHILLFKIRLTFQQLCHPPVCRQA